MIRNTKILKNAAFLVIKTESSGGSTSTILIGNSSSSAFTMISDRLKVNKLSLKVS